MELPVILDEQNVDAAAKLLHRYYLETDKQGLLSTGSYFDDWAGRGDKESRDTLTDSDAVAVSMLSVTVPPKAWIGLQERSTAERVTDLLRQIPTQVPLSSLTRDQAAALLIGKGPAALLWEELRRTADTRWGIGATTASKIMARKRPELIPIWDIIIGKVIGKVIGKRSSRGQWMAWHALLTDGSGLPERLTEIHKLSGVERPLSELRIMDVILWRYGKDRGFSGGRSSGKAGAVQVEE
jgi:hypothetical protein